MLDGRAEIDFIERFEAVRAETAGGDDGPRRGVHIGLERPLRNKHRVDHLFHAHGLAQFPAFNAFLVGQGLVAGPAAVHAARFLPYCEKEGHGTEAAHIQKIARAALLIPPGAPGHVAPVHAFRIARRPALDHMAHGHGIIRILFQLLAAYVGKTVLAEASSQLARGHQQAAGHGVKIAVLVQGHAVRAAGLTEIAGHRARAFLAAQQGATEAQQLLVERMDGPIEAPGGKHGAQQIVNRVHILVAARGLAVLAQQKGVPEPGIAGRSNGLGHARGRLAQGAVGRRIEQVGLAQAFRVLALEQPARRQDQPPQFALLGQTLGAQAFQMADELLDVFQIHSAALNRSGRSAPAGTCPCCWRRR